METLHLDRREYVLVPPDLPGSPLLIFLHGMGCTAGWAVDETRLDTFARERGFALLAPQALRPKPNEPAKFLTNAPRWNDASKEDEADDVEFLDTTSGLWRSAATSSHFMRSPRLIFLTCWSRTDSS